MQGIYYKEGVYVVIDHDDEHDDCVYHYNYKTDALLYGGRVGIIRTGKETAEFKIDGIDVIRVVVQKPDTIYVGESLNIDNLDLDFSLPLSNIIAHLNAIEANGVDAFIQHYKESIESLKVGLEELNQKTELELPSEDGIRYERVLGKLQKVRNILLSLFAIDFNFRMLMNAGLENQKVVSVCQSIMDSFA